MAAAGADIVDVGGESTRPGASPISPADERARVVPVIRGAGRRRGDGLDRHPPRQRRWPRRWMPAPPSSTTSRPWRTTRAAGACRRRARLPRRADAHARRSGDDERARRLRRHRARGRPPNLPRRIAAAERAGIARGRHRHRPRHRLRQAGAAFAGTAAPPAGAGSVAASHPGGRVAQIVHRPHRRRTGPATAACPARSPPACSPCRVAPHILRVHDVAETVQATPGVDRIGPAMIGSMAPSASPPTRRGLLPPPRWHDPRYARRLSAPAPCTRKIRPHSTEAG